jgi:hypothetical protein
MKRLLIAAAAALLLATSAHAGQTCEQKQPLAADVERSLDLALRVARRLDDSGARVVVLARAGQDLSRWGLRWSHLGYAYRDDSAAQPRWRVLHKLNDCGSASGALFRQGLAEFFLDDLHEYSAAYAVPTPALQAQLLPLLQDNRRVAQLDEPRYNMVAYPWAQTYQQSNTSQPVRPAGPAPLCALLLGAVPGRLATTTCSSSPSPCWSPTSCRWLAAGRAWPAW